MGCLIGLLKLLIIVLKVILFIVGGAMSTYGLVLIVIADESDFVDEMKRYIHVTP